MTTTTAKTFKPTEPAPPVGINDSGEVVICLWPPVTCPGCEARAASFLIQTRQGWRCVECRGSR